MKKEIYLTSKEKKLLESDMERDRMGQILMEHGAKVRKEGNEAMWDILKELWPNIVKFSHPPKGKWSVVVDEPVKEKEKKECQS